jgi:hypothetical protein
MGLPSWLPRALVRAVGRGGCRAVTHTLPLCPAVVGWAAFWLCVLSAEAAAQGAGLAGVVSLLSRCCLVGLKQPAGYQRSDQTV